MTLSTSQMEAITELRQLFTEEVKQNGDLYDPLDIERILHDDKWDHWGVRRYLEYKNYQVLDAFELIKESLQWRESIKLNTLKTSDFPREVLTSGFMQLTKDRNGLPALWIRVEIYRKFPEIQEHVKRCIAFYLNAVDQWVGPQGGGIYLHMANTGLQQLDFDIVRFIIMIKEYFPAVLKYFVINHLPSILNWALRLILRYDYPIIWPNMLNYIVLTLNFSS